MQADVTENQSAGGRQQSASNRLKQQREKLIAEFKSGKRVTFMENHARILDEYFRERFETSMIGPQMGINKNPYVFIAQGGYGRGEQCVHSDVDLLFLFKKRVPDTAENLIREIVYPLWDIGLEVGYATRSIKECLSLATKDYEILTPLLDARFICGMSLLYTDFMDQVRRKILDRHSRKIIKWLIESNRLRHIHFGDSTYRLEPNLKEGQGGLRDYHTMLWLGRIKYQFKQARDLEFLGRLSHVEYINLTEALEFIWHVRNRLHLLTDRKSDQLHFENQIKLAESMKYKQVNGQQPVECFLGDLHGKMDFIKQQLLIMLYELGYSAAGKTRKMPGKQSVVAEIVVQRDMLDFRSTKDILLKPHLLLRIFEESLRLKLPLSPAAKRVVVEFGYIADENLTTSPEFIKSFERILLSPAPTFNVLEEMLNTGFLVRLIPEFKGIINRIQYDEYHLYPVDKHLLRAIQTTKNFANRTDESLDPLYTDIYRGLKNKKLLLWAVLLHDIGKGDPDDPQQDHSKSGARMAHRIMRAWGHKERDADTVAFLVERHLYLIKTATRRDIHHEETAIVCAREIGDAERLKMLYLLTVADSMSTGPNAWNSWTASLLRDLFLKVLNIIDKGELASRQAVKTQKKKKEILLAAVDTQSEKQKLDELFNVLSPRYLLYATVDQIREDLERYNRLGSRDFVWNVTRTADPNRRTVKICAKDRPGLFSKIAGVFTLNNIDIIDAQIFTWRNQIAVDIFEVTPPPDQIFEDESWLRTEQNLQMALTGELDLTRSLNRKISSYRRRKALPLSKPQRIEVDNASSSFFTLVEVFTDDFPGLLYTITDALYRCQMDIWVAKIATKADQVVDVFYVRDFDGQKVDAPDQVQAIQTAIADGISRARPKKKKGY